MNPETYLEVLYFVFKENKKKKKVIRGLLNRLIVLALEQNFLLREWTHQKRLNKGPVLALTHLVGGTEQQKCAEANSPASTAPTSTGLIGGL